MKKLILPFTALSLVAGAAPAKAPPQQCRDSKGKFVKCPEKPKQCRDSKGHFAKCK